MTYRVVAGLAVVAAVAAAPAQIQRVVPNGYESTPGTATFLGPFAGARTYQLLIHESQLTDFVGLQLTGMTWRLPTSATSSWPATDQTITSFDIFLSQGVAPSDRSLTFADNVVGPQTQVRSGSLTVPTGSFGFGGSPNAFGMNIGFNPWTYAGGHLLIELRHTGVSSTRSVDAIATSTSGYGTLFSAAWGSGYAATTGSQGNFAVTQLTAVPEPATLLALGAGLGILARRRRRK
jgi:hypothetical protein